MRIALVTPRFWPLCDAAARHAGEFAAALKRQGAACTVLTPGFTGEKTREIRFPEFRVHNVSPRPATQRSRWKVARNIANWLVEHQRSFDAVYCYGVSETTCAIIEKLTPTTTPVVIRVTKTGPDGDDQWPQSGLCRGRLKAIIARANHVLLSNACSKPAWLQNGVAPGRLSVAPFGVGECEPTLDRQAARSMLAETHPIFRLPETARLALFVGELTKQQQLVRLVHWWGKWRQRAPELHLWMIGEGLAGDAIWKAIRQNQLEESVLLPGQFDHPEPLYAAADLVVHPGEHVECDLPLLEAMAFGKPIVSAPSAAAKELLGDYAGASFATHADEAAWRQAIINQPLGAFPWRTLTIDEEAARILQLIG